MDQEKQESMDSEDKGKNTTGWTRGNAKWLIIIGILLAIIAVGLGYIMDSPRGKIPVTVESFTPRGEIMRTTNFTIEFSQDMVEESDVGVQLDSAPVVFTPTIPGKYRWIARNKLRFFPEIVLPPSTEYTAEILPEICTDEGTYLKGDRKYTLYTQRFRVDNAHFTLNLAGPEEGGKVTISATIEFNYPVEPGEIKKHVAITYESGMRIPYSVVTQKSGLIMELETEPVTRGEADKNMQLWVSNRLIPVDGSLGLHQPYFRAFVMKAKEKLKVEGVFVEQQGKYGYLKIRFSSPVAVDMAKRHISVEPTIEHKLAANYNYIELRGNFEAGKGYTIGINQELAGKDGSKLSRPFSTRVVMQNMEPSVDFVGDGTYLSRTGNLNVGLTTINIEKLDIEVQKIYANNLGHLINTGGLRGRYNLQHLGKQIYSEEITIPSRPNEEVITSINMESYLADEHTGIFAVMARDVNRRWRYSRRWVMITDLGIMLKRAGGQILVWVNSLSSLEPVSGAEVTLFSMNNQVIAKGYTDGDGLTSFELTDETLEEFSSYTNYLLITAAKGKDLSFVETQRQNSRISTTDFDVTGQPYLRHGYDAFVYGDRDIYRPGETAKLAVIVRGPNATAPPPFPLKMEILGPDNRIYEELLQKTSKDGGYEFQIELPSYVRTGRYTA
ncbi:MG2 domain-containing protein, partial [Candidatus Poribacteria bacterium]